MQSGVGRLTGMSAIGDFVEWKTSIHEVDLATSQP